MYYIVRTSYTFLPCFITLPFLLHFFISNVFSTLYIYVALLMVESNIVLFKPLLEVLISVPSLNSHCPLFGSD